MKNLILDASNVPIQITNFLGTIVRQSIDGLPLGAVSESTTGEIAVKVIIVGAAATISPTNLATSAKQDQQTALLEGSLLPYGADEQDISYVGSTNNINTIEYKLATVLQKTRTFTYVGGTPSTNDALLATTVDS